MAGLFPRWSSPSGSLGMAECDEDNAKTWAAWRGEWRKLSHAWGVLMITPRTIACLALGDPRDESTIE